MVESDDASVKDSTAVMLNIRRNVNSQSIGFSLQEAPRLGLFLGLFLGRAELCAGFLLISGG